VGCDAAMVVGSGERVSLCSQEPKGIPSGSAAHTPVVVYMMHGGGGGPDPPLVRPCSFDRGAEGLGMAESLEPEPPNMHAEASRARVRASLCRHAG
jgi:hypothetical protein